MTTAHRPTYHPAVGRVHAGGYRFDVARRQFSSRELPAHMTLKTRADLAGRSGAAEDREALKRALLQGESKHRQGLADEQSRRGVLPEIPVDDSAAASSSSAVAAPASPFAPEDDEEEEGPSSAAAVDLSQFDDEDEVPTGPGGGGRGEGESEDSDDDDDSDEDAELARELELIRREREQARQRAAEAEAAAAEEAHLAKLNSNPLLPTLGAASAASAAAAAAAVSAGVKRRWNDDVVFKNQLKGDVTQAPKKRFINDAIRSDFHRSFLKRYVK